MARQWRTSARGPAGLRRAAGFTLIEVVVVMTILAVVGGFAGLALRQMAQGFVLSGEALSASLKTANAMARLHREMQQLTDVTEAEDDHIVYSRLGERLAIGRVGSTVKLDVDGDVPDADTGDVLLGGIAAFTLSYEDQDGNAWTTARSLDELYTIRISLTLDIGDGVTLPTAINPIYNRTLNGPI